MTAKQAIKALEKIIAKHGNVRLGVDYDVLRGCDEDNPIADVEVIKFLDYGARNVELFRRPVAKGAMT